MFFLRVFGRLLGLVWNGSLRIFGKSLGVRWGSLGWQPVLSLAFLECGLGPFGVATRVFSKSCCGLLGRRPVLFPLLFWLGLSLFGWQPVSFWQVAWVCWGGSPCRSLVSDGGGRPCICVIMSCCLGWQPVFFLLCSSISDRWLGSVRGGTPCLFGTLGLLGWQPVFFFRRWRFGIPRTHPGLAVTHLRRDSSAGSLDTRPGTRAECGDSLCKD